MNIKESITLGLIWHYLTIESKQDFYYRYMQLIRNINNIKNVTNQSWWVKKQSNMSTPVTTYFCQCKGAANQKLLCWVLASALSAGKWSWKPQKWILQCMCPSWAAPLSHKAKQVFAGVSTFFATLQVLSLQQSVWALHFLFILLPSIQKSIQPAMVSMTEVNNLLYSKVKLSIVNIKWLRD